MRTTLTFAVVLGLLFASTVVINAAYGILSPEHVRAVFETVVRNPIMLAGVVVAVLAIDSVLAVPTITTVVLAGYFLGPFWGGLMSTIGILAAGSICFWGARLCGESRFVPPRKRVRIIETVGTIGPAPLMLSRIAPILPEVLSALAGAGGMPAARYYLYFAAGNVPFAFLAAWAGSISSLERPWPALVVGVGFPTLGAALLIYRRWTGIRRAYVAPEGETG